jgi:hypothetical protein
MFRDFLMLLRRYTASSVLNIVGMALAFAAAYLILVQVNFDMSYNRKIPNAENIYRLEITQASPKRDIGWPCGIVTSQVSYAKEFRKS